MAVWKATIGKKYMQGFWSKYTSSHKAQLKATVGVTIASTAAFMAV